MKRVNNNNLLGVIQTHSGVFGSVLQLRIQGSAQRAAWECAAHYRKSTQSYRQFICIPTPRIPAKFRCVELGILTGLRTACLESGRFRPRSGVVKVDRERTEEPSASTASLQTASLTCSSSLHVKHVPVQSLLTTQ